MHIYILLACCSVRLSFPVLLQFKDTLLCIFIDRVAGAIIRLVASVCVYVCVSVRLSVGTLQFEPFDL